MTPSQSIWPHLTLFRAAGARPPIALVAGLDGFPFVFRELSSLLGDQQPVFALQLPGAHVDEPVEYCSIEDIAAVFELQIDAAYPRGPIILGGFSMGGLVAFELARHFARRGRQVPLLIALDAFAPGFHRQHLPMLRRLRAHAGALRERPRKYLFDRGVMLGRRMLAPFGADWRLIQGVTLSDPRQNEHLHRMMILWERAADAYRPGSRLDTPLLLVRRPHPDLPLGSRDERTYDWEKWVADVVEVVEVRGEHAEVLTSAHNQRVIAAAIARQVAASTREADVQGGVR